MSRSSVQRDMQRAAGSKTATVSIAKQPTAEKIPLLALSSNWTPIHWLGCGTLFAHLWVMEFVCRHCEEVCQGEAYRVTSVENDIVLLDMIVCQRCALLARGLELPTQKIDSQVACY